MKPRLWNIRYNHDVWEECRQIDRKNLDQLKKNLDVKNCYNKGDRFIESLGWNLERGYA